jgi:hypothetical protein
MTNVALIRQNNPKHPIKYSLRFNQHIITYEYFLSYLTYSRTEFLRYTETSFRNMAPLARRPMQHIDRKELYTNLEARIQYLHSFLDFSSRMPQLTHHTTHHHTLTTHHRRHRSPHHRRKIHPRPHSRNRKHRVQETPPIRHHSARLRNTLYILLRPRRSQPHRDFTANSAPQDVFARIPDEIMQ